MKIRAIVAIIALLSLASACGSEPGTPTANTESAAVQPAGSAASDSAGGDSAMGDETATDDDGAMDDDTVTDSSSDADGDQGAVDQGGVDQPGADDTDAGDAGAPGDPEFCKQLVAAEDQLDSIDQAYGSGDLASANKALTADMDVFKKLADSAPSQIAPAMQDIIAALAAAQKAMSGGTPDASALGGLTTMGGDLATLGTYLATNCAGYMGN